MVTEIRNQKSKAARQADIQEGLSVCAGPGVMHPTIPMVPVIIAASGLKNFIKLDGLGRRDNHGVGNPLSGDRQVLRSTASTPGCSMKQSTRDGGTSRLRLALSHPAQFFLPKSRQSIEVNFIDAV